MEAAAGCKSIWCGCIAGVLNACKVGKMKSISLSKHLESEGMIILMARVANAEGCKIVLACTA